jgi:hypothetical protein
MITVFFDTFSSSTFGVGVEVIVGGVIGYGSSRIIAESLDRVIVTVFALMGVKRDERFETTPSVISERESIKKLTVYGRRVRKKM